MKSTLYIALMTLSLNVWADCPDENISLTDKLSEPMRKGSEIIAVVKGTLGTEVDEDGFLVSAVDVTGSYGLEIPSGRYLLNYSNYWGQGCFWYEEKPRRPDENVFKKPPTVYFAISRFHGRTLATPENYRNGLFLVGKNIIYEDQESSKQRIEQTLFEQNVLKGIPKKFWLPERP
jgi:hypothetical protein